MTEPRIPKPYVWLGLFVFGVSGVRHRAFLVGTLLGSIPAAIPATLIGSRLVHPDATTNPLATWGPVLLLLGMWIVCSLYLIRSRRGQKAWAGDPVLSQN